MTNSALDNWPADFAIDPRLTPNFFASKEDLISTVPQAHILRYAFDRLELDGILCSNNTPLIYFKAVDQIKPDEIFKLHRAFWNHGGAPILALVSPAQVHIYSGMSLPVSGERIQGDPPFLVDTLDRVAQGLREFVVSVESGEYFRRHARSFDPAHRVDRDLLTNLRKARDLLDEASKRTLSPRVLDALLCRVVFTCYLFDRGVIVPKYLQDLGIPNAEHLRDVLQMHPTRDAKASLYKLFEELGRDFNGDLFSDDLISESNKITIKHIKVLGDFFHGTDLEGGQKAFWPYDFGYIPIETISAIYEHFLKKEDQEDGAVYTPRFLVELLLDGALDRFSTLLDKKFLDPACGSGIFLVGLFNRIAEEWKQANPTATYDRRAKELLLLLQQCLFGIDKNPTACRITAFSLNLAYLNQLSPSDIQRLQRKRGALPRLVLDPESEDDTAERDASQRNIHCVDFFRDHWEFPASADLVLGNPPWGSIAHDGTPASDWCAKRKQPLPDKQIAVAFIWKAARHTCEHGRVCFVLPHGTLLNHGSKALEFQRAWVRRHRIYRVVNLADVRKFLFREAIHPAIIVEFNNAVGDPQDGMIDYWTPKSDWMISRAEIIDISPMDRKKISVALLLDDLDGPDAPQIWTQLYWASRRDLRLIDKLSLYPRLRDHVRQASDKHGGKPWVRAEGFQPVSTNDDLTQAKKITLPSRRFIQATSKDISLFVLPTDCELLDSNILTVRARSNTNTDIFRAPHVLITKGFKRIAYADFDVSFRHALRGIHGPIKDRNLLLFLTAYLRSDLAQYFAFHTSANRSMFHEEVHVNELLRLPFPMPSQQPDEERCESLVSEVARIVEDAFEQTRVNFMTRGNSIQAATAAIAPLVDEYFDIQPSERLLIEDTINILMPSIQPSQRTMPVPTVTPCTEDQQTVYVKRVCDTLNMWTKKGQYMVRGDMIASAKLGIGIAKLEKIERSDTKRPMERVGKDLLEALDRLRSAIPTSQRTFDATRELMIFDQNSLYIVKPIAQRYWSQTAALNDADEIAGTILMHPRGERA